MYDAYIIYDWEFTGCAQKQRFRHFVLPKIFWQTWLSSTYGSRNLEVQAVPTIFVDDRQSLVRVWHTNTNIFGLVCIVSDLLNLFTNCFRHTTNHNMLFPDWPKPHPAKASFDHSVNLALVATGSDSGNWLREMIQIIHNFSKTQNF